MMQDQGDGGDVSIGEENQLRDQEMLHDLQDEDGDAPKPRGRPAKGGKPPPAPAEHADATWQPGDPGQPDRSHSEGLTGSGPAQPDP